MHLAVAGQLGHIHGEQAEIDLGQVVNQLQFEGIVFSAAAGNGEVVRSERGHPRHHRGPDVVGIRVERDRRTGLDSRPQIPTDVIHAAGWGRREPESLFFVHARTAGLDDVDVLAPDHALNP